MTPIPRLRPYEGPAFLSYGFRPFFLVGAVYAALAVLTWLPQYFGALALVNAFSPLACHVHEMLFGFVPAIIAGFLLTAVPNWTGRLPLQGKPLLILLMAWVLGRVAIGFSSVIGWLPTMVADCAFLALVVAAITREVVAGKNWRNLKVVTILTLMLTANLGFHLEKHFNGNTGYAERLGVSLILILITIVGGRIIPSFTHNSLVKMNPGRLPAQAGPIDRAFVAIAVAALSTWVVSPSSPATGLVLLVAALTQTVQLARWAGWRTWRNPIVLVLHVAYAFIPVGFALSAFAAFFPEDISPSAGVHAWTVGAMSGMILAVMTRASLGHTGHALRADWITNGIYVAVLISALTRIAAALEPPNSLTLLSLSGIAWIIAFLGFAIGYGPMLLKSRL